AFEAPLDQFDGIARGVAGHGYDGGQIPGRDGRLFDLKRAAASKTYWHEVRGVLAYNDLQAFCRSTHLQGQLVAVHPAYDLAFDGFAPEKLRGSPRARQAWAVEQLLLAAKASANLGLAP